MSADSFPVEVEALAVLKHQKTKSCMLSVLWSDQTHILIYREFKEFEKLHKRLKRKFPIESGVLKKSDRTIPTFRDVNRILQKTHKLSCCTEVLTSLQIYCQGLLRTQPSISRGEDVVCFFKAQNQDLDPFFQKTEASTEEPAGPSRLAITQPLVAPLYRCLAAFETEDVKMNPFRTSRAETLDVLVKDRSGWWLVENHRKQLAWFPASYLEKTEDDSVVREAVEEGMLYYLTQSYEAKQPDELSVKSGVLVEVLETLENGWWLIRYNGKSGYVPSAFLQPYRNPHRTFLALALSRLSSSIPNISGVPRPPGQASPIQPKGNLDEAAGVPPFHRMRGEKLSTQSPTQAQSPGATADAAGPGGTTKTECLADSSGNGSRQESLWAWVSAGGRVETPCSAFGGGGNPGKQPCNASLASRDGGSDLSLGFHRGRPPVPFRPSPHEILQKCSAATQRAMWGALREAAPDPCPPSGPHSMAL
ncbi:hypothetical protein JRQ81_010483 [Phrynocephalus forsythii]|uniref:NADPH oxidase organizer 1 n=1 Tax=Phrynocephalus forsythii TaxID=171643 RepID=A0A9Q1ARN5_9SAUR|nr:hypothetical protein JRQ81_010483 [Phrynocephalus forsythii]